VKHLTQTFRKQRPRPFFRISK